jgi:hypothetical protein
VMIWMPVERIACQGAREVKQPCKAEFKCGHG